MFLFAPTVPSDPEPEEDRADRVGRLDVQRALERQARPGDVVVNADREPAPRTLARELLEHPRHHAGGELLRRQPIAAADHPREDPFLVLVGLGQRGDHVEEQRFADRAGLLGPVQHRDPAHARGQRVQQRPGRERPVQPHLHDTDPLTARVEPVHGLPHGLRA